ncbi:hypothetical protein FRC03_004874 [Tulasnella sp. 419]|nr:hypothetical protein FRC03_004874 [Tulasnella sp. 419]
MLSGYPLNGVTHPSSYPHLNSRHHPQLYSSKPSSPTFFTTVAPSHLSTCVHGGVRCRDTVSGLCNSQARHDSDKLFSATVKIGSLHPWAINLKAHALTGRESIFMQ